MVQNQRSPGVSAEAVAPKSDRLSKLVTGHDVLDKVLVVYGGMSILVLDETYSEARNFMRLIFEKYNPQLRFTEISDKASLSGIGHVEILTGDSLAGRVVKINAIRRKHPGEIIMHSYLPSLLISQPHDNVLKYVDAWKNASKEFGTIDIYLMPSNSFKDAERKIVGLLGSRVEFGITRKDGRVSKFFVVSGCCRPEYNMREFEYAIEEGRILVQWEGALTDRPAEVSEGALEKRFGELKVKPETFILQRGANASRAKLSAGEYVLLHQLVGMSAMEITRLFPEKPGEMLQLLAKWELAGVVAFERDYSSDGVNALNAKGGGYSFLNTLRLILPDRLVAWSYKLGTQAVPLEYFVANRDALGTVIEMLTESIGITDKPDYIRSMPQIERAVLEIAARRAALLEVPRHHESTAAAAARKYIPKIMRVSLLSAFILRSHVEKISDSEYHITLNNCYLCGTLASKVPICSSVSGGLEGVCGTIFKLKADCTEVRCRSMGDKNCEFRLRIIH